MSHAAVRIHERESFGSTFASALMMTNPKMNNRGNRSVGWPSLEDQMKGSSHFFEDYGYHFTYWPKNTSPWQFAFKQTQLSVCVQNISCISQKQNRLHKLFGLSFVFASLASVVKTERHFRMICFREK